MVRHTPDQTRVIRASAIVGIGLSGFFDGILLHQVLQWHHLLSLVPGGTWRSVSNQILADGLFHVLMYLVTASGLVLLWCARRSLSAQSVSWRMVLGGGLMGFGVWNLIDVGFFHWILRIHRIRINVPDPLAYDIGWLMLFGILPLLAAWLIMRSDGDEGAGTARTAAMTLMWLSVLAAPLASLPAPGSRSAVVFLDARGSSATAFRMARAAGVSVLWVNPEGTLMAVQLDEAATTQGLYRAGARLVTRSPALAGCAAAARADPAVA